MPLTHSAHGRPSQEAERRQLAPSVLAELPDRFRRYVVPQHHAAYKTTEHDTWSRLLSRAAELVDELCPWLHPSYVEGFKRLIQPWSKIPRLSAIAAALAEFGWRTVCVDGYIPPDIYAGLIARGVFPVSRGIRRPEHLDFAPTPDLAHDLLGHIPMLISAEHRQFLQRLATAMAIAPKNALDQESYLANRGMAALRCKSSGVSAKLTAAEARVALVQRDLAETPSALTQLGRMYLWSIEFGLMGTKQEFRIYGAGLLSSPAETRAVCLGRAPVRNFSLSVVRRDIHFSKPQSAYYVAPDYACLNQMLSALERRLSADADLGGRDQSPAVRAARAYRGGG